MAFAASRLSLLDASRVNQVHEYNQALRPDQGIPRAPLAESDEDRL